MTNLKYCLLFLLCPLFSMCQPFPVKGRVINDQGEPVISATVILKRTNQSTASDSKGVFSFPYSLLSDTFIISAIGYEIVEEPNNERNLITIVLKRKITELDQVLIQAYGTTTKRLNTGSITRVTAEEIIRQPVSNPLAALQGRVPGLIITQSSGVPGSAFKLEIRGKSVLDPFISSNDPLFVIDGVPFAPGNDAVSSLSSAATISRDGSGGISPFNSINPADIESIEVLKDADATAIYGSRGANGVILITTKRGRSGKSAFSVNVYSATSRTTRTMDMLNTNQYLQMRRAGYAGDGIVPSPSDAPDLLVWDTTRFTNFKKLLIGGHAHNTDAQLSFSGGGDQLQYFIGAGYNRQSTVFPGAGASTRGSFQFSLNQLSLNKKMNLVLTAGYSATVNNLPSADLTSYINLPPNFPSFYDANGRLKWEDAGYMYADIGLSNPFAYLLKEYSQKTNYLSGGFQFSYKIINGLVFRTSLGYNTTVANEKLTEPNSSLDPNAGVKGSLGITNSSIRNWNIEPQLEYANSIGPGRLNVLLGATLLENESQHTGVRGQEYANDDLIGSLTGAGIILASNAYAKYRYQALFARVNYNWREKYIINLSGRRDGSSRFGPGNRFSNFGAAGLAWIFSSEPFIKNAIPFLSFGKLRGSYGSAGNDRIGNYQYLDSWRATIMPYQGVPGLVPSRLFNPGYSWEINRKLEAALELVFLKERIFITAAFYRNRNSNQLVSYNLPAQTGFAQVTKNLPALVQNQGFEFAVSSKNITAKSFTWVTSFNISLPQNKLISFPGLASSNYASIYVEGASLSVIRKIKYLGVDPATGIYSFEDVNKDGNLIYPDDFQVLGNLDPKFYGGLQNTITCKGLELDIFFEFKKQKGTNYLNDFRFEIPFSIPGFARNQPVAVLKAWQRPGHISEFQKFSADPSSAAVAATYNLYASDAVYSDASFIRLKNVSLSYSLPAVWLKKVKLQSSRIYCQAQNLFTITNYKGSDPETQNLYTLPPLTTIAFGIQLTL